MKKLYTTLLLLILLNTNAWAVTYTLIDPNATPATVAMYNKITGYIAGNQTALGQHIYNSDPVPSQDWYAIEGKYPLFQEWDWGDYSNGNYQSLSYMPANFTKDMQQLYANGGIVGFFWAMNNWSSTCSNGCGYGDLTGSTATRILTGGADRAIYLAQLQNLANWCNGPMANVPMLFRPFHEGDGNSLWWGTSSTSDANYILLWKDIVTTLEGMGVHNLIYVYAPQLRTGYTTYAGTRFPGNSYVDIFGIDRYYGQQDSNVIANDVTAYDTTEVAAVAASKPYAIVEGYNDQGAAYNSTIWTTWMSAIQADSEANKATYIMIWISHNYGNSSSWGPVLNRADQLNFQSMISGNSNLLQLATFNWGFNMSIQNGVTLKGKVQLK